MLNHTIMCYPLRNAYSDLRTNIFTYQTKYTYSLLSSKQIQHDQHYCTDVPHMSIYSSLTTPDLDSIMQKVGDWTGLPPRINMYAPNFYLNSLYGFNNRTFKVTTLEVSSFTVLSSHPDTAGDPAKMRKIRRIRRTNMRSS